MFYCLLKINTIITTLTNLYVMEKKVEVITKEGKTVRVMPHMLEDMALFGVTQVRKIVKETPKELIKVPVRPVEVLPEMVNTIPINRVFEPTRAPEITKTEPLNVVLPTKTPPVKITKKAKK